GRYPADIAWLESVTFGFVEVYLDLNVRHIHLELCMHIRGPIDLGKGPLHLRSFAAQDFEIGAVEADHDIVARSHQHLVDPLVEVVLDISVEPWVTVDHLLDGGQRGAIVNGLVNADPQLGEIDACHLLSLHGTPDMGPEGGHPRNRPQVATDLKRHPRYFIR